MARKKAGKRATPQAPAYLPRVLEVAAGLKPGEVYHVDVHHDHDCQLLAGTGPCNCQADVKLRRPQ